MGLMDNLEGTVSQISSFQAVGMASKQTDRQTDVLANRRLHRLHCATL